MSAVLRQQRFFAGAKARLERQGEWGRLAESGEAAVAAWDAWDPPVGQDQVHVVPSLLRVGALAGGRDATADLEDEDLLFESDGADPDSETDADDDDTNLGEPRTAAQAQEARAGAGCTDLDEAIAAAARSEQAGAAAGEAGRSWTDARQQQRVSRAGAARRPPMRRTRGRLESLTRFWHLWLMKDGVVVPTEGPAWEQARRPSRGWA